MNEELKALIEKHLPGMVGTQLKEVLTKAEADANLVVAQRVKMRAQDEEIEKLRRLGAMEDALNKSSQEYDKKRIELEKREAVLVVMEKNAKERIDEMRGVVRDVFSNSRLKYVESGTIPVANMNPTQYGPLTGGINKTTEVTQE